MRLHSIWFFRGIAILSTLNIIGLDVTSVNGSCCVSSDWLSYVNRLSWVPDCRVGFTRLVVTSWVEYRARQARCNQTRCQCVIRTIACVLQDRLYTYMDQCFRHQYLSIKFSVDAQGSCVKSGIIIVFLF